MKLHNPRHDWPKVAKAKVYAESCYISFGVWFGRVKQIDKMRELYDLLPVKPEWLTREQIDEYAARMGVK